MTTIYALASGSMRSGVAVIRVSGPQAHETLFQLSGRKNVPLRQAVLVTLTDPQSMAPIDQALALSFKSPASFTGEDVVEYHVHGGRAVIEGVLRVLSGIPDCRQAEAGEFTKRAFENNKIDLTEAEAIADLIDAETEAQRIQALGQLGGALSKIYQGWTDRLTKILAHQEADIEFPEDDLPAGLSDKLLPGIDGLKHEILSHLNDNRRGERLRNGIRIAIIGAPNAGKSSLLNALAERDAAIVSDQAGTTRDVIEVHLDLGGYPVILADTAGLRETDNLVEAEGIRRAQKAAATADLKIALFDGTVAEDTETRSLIDENTLVVRTKSDNAEFVPTQEGFALSSQNGDGMEAFLKALTDKTAALFVAQSATPALTRERHRAALNDAAECLNRAIHADLPELAAEDLRLALRALGRITGRVHVEELLDRIFRDFCIGK